MGSLTVLASLLIAAGAGSSVAGGEEASTCQYPAVAAVLSEGTIFCSASLVHPRLVLLAAHCILPGFGMTPDVIAFGEDSEAPAREIAVDACSFHPDFELSIESSGVDVAYCTLTEPVEDVPSVPPLMGCEQEALMPGAPLTIVGFGSTYGVKVDGMWVEFSGAGPKRSGPQVLDQIVDGAVWMLGDDVSACPGDSGGPALIQLEDGSWRVIGSASTNHPDAPQDGGNTCGYGSVYSNFANVMPWIEAETGFDITPCHDADGTWAPTEACDAFPLAPGDAAASSRDWADGCATDERSGPGQSCGPSFGEGGTTGGSDDGDVSSDDGGETTTAPGPDPGASNTDTMPVGSGGPHDPGETDGVADPEAEPDAEDPRGCSCTAADRPGSRAVFLLALVLLPLRRRLAPVSLRASRR